MSSPYDELPYRPSQLRTPRLDRFPMSTDRRAMFAAYVATRQWLAGLAGEPAVVNEDAVAMWARETQEAL